MRPGSNSLTLRASNRVAVLERIRLQAPVTRAEIARDTGLTPAAVTNIVNHLLGTGLIVELGRRKLGRGKPAVELDLAPDGAYSIGLHLDRDVLTGVLVDLKGTSLAAVRVELSPPSPEQALELLAGSHAELVATAGIDRGKLLGTGVVTVGPLDLENGTVRGPPNFPGWENVPLRRLVQDRVGVPVILENNATAAAIGEYWYGAGRGHRNFLYLYIGLGVGSGLFIDNHVYRGSGLNAGEVGHVHVGRGSDLFTLESLTSMLALRRDLGAAYAEPEAVAAALQAGDAHLLEWLEGASSHLAQVLAGIDDLLDLDAVILGGRHAAEVLAHLVERTEERFRGLVMANRPRRAQLHVGRAGDDTAALGAATLPLYNAFSTLPAAVK